MIIICYYYNAPSHLAQSTMAAGAGASQAKDLKKVSIFIWRDALAYASPPIAFETSGAHGPLPLIFLKELSHRLSATTGDTRSQFPAAASTFQWLFNAAYILGTLISSQSSDLCLCSRGA